MNMEETHKDQEFLPTVDPKDWPKTLEMMEEYIRGFWVVYGKLRSYVLRDDLEPPATASDNMHHTNGSKNLTHDEEMIAHGSILSGSTVSVSDPEAIGPFTK